MMNTQLHSQPEYGPNSLLEQRKVLFELFTPLEVKNMLYEQLSAFIGSEAQDMDNRQRSDHMMLYPLLVNLVTDLEITGQVPPGPKPGIEIVAALLHEVLLLMNTHHGSEQLRERIKAAQAYVVE
jgi:hypothetical protein